MKSTTSSRFGVTDSGAIEMSASPVARIGTLVSWLTGMISVLTPSRLAYSSAKTQAGPENCGPLPVVFSGSHGNSPMAAKRSDAALLDLVDGRTLAGRRDVAACPGRRGYDSRQPAGGGSLDEIGKTHGFTP